MGPGQVMQVQTPYLLQNLEATVFQDCAVNKNVKVWGKIRTDGLLTIMLHNVSADPVHITPRTTVLMCRPEKVSCTGEEGEIIQISGVSKEDQPSLPPQQSLDQQIQNLGVVVPQQLEPLSLEQLRQSFPRVFDLSPTAMEITPAMAKMAIGLDDVQWKAGRGRWTSNTQYQTISQCDRQAVEKFTQEQINRGIVSRMDPSQKGFFSQSIFIPKKNGTPRWVVDFRRLNTLLWAWTSTLVHTIHAVKNIPKTWTVYSLIDLENGFFNIPLTDELKPYFCCEVLGQRLMYNRLPQGWNSSSGIFHDIVRRCLEGIDGVVTYIDDILVGGRNPQEHDEIIKKVFQRLEIYGFHVNYAKMQYRKNEVEFLGFNLRGGKVYMDSYIKNSKPNCLA